jgi:hypothetical protein
MFQIKLVEELKTHILCAATFSENRTVYEVVWKSMEEWDRVWGTI